MKNRSLKMLASQLYSDALRYRPLGGFYKHPGFWVGATYRYGRFSKSLPMVLRIPTGSTYWMLDLVFRALLNIRISTDAKIDGGLCLIHPWNVLVGAAEIGENCLIFHEVTIGTNANPPDVLPRIGRDVDIYVGARVLGDLTVGNGAKIGANCVVTSTVPSGATVVMAPNRVISAAAVAAFGPRRNLQPTLTPDSSGLGTKPAT